LIGEVGAGDVTGFAVRIGIEVERIDGGEGRLVFVEPGRASA
jgi:hypothetical protein